MSSGTTRAAAIFDRLVGALPSLQTGRPVEPESATLLIAGITGLTEGTGTFEQAGDIDLEALEAERLRRRNVLLIQLAQTNYADVPSDRGKAHAIYADWEEYFTSAWRREQGLSECPIRYRNRPDLGAFWRIGKLENKLLAPESIRLIIRQKLLVLPAGE